MANKENRCSPLVDVLSAGQNDCPDRLCRIRSAFGNDQPDFSVGEGLGQIVAHGHAAAIDFFGHLAARHVVLFAQDPRRHIGGAGLTDENWNLRPGNSLSVIPPGDTSFTVPAISSTGAVKCRSCMRMTDSRVFLTRFRIFSYSISSSVFPCASLPTRCREVLYSRE